MYVAFSEEVKGVKKATQPVNNRYGNSLCERGRGSQRKHGDLTTKHLLFSYITYETVELKSKS